MKTILFLDVENMGGKNIRRFVDGIIEQYAPCKTVMVYAKTANIAPCFRKNIARWSVCRCKPGPNAADHVIQSRMGQAAKDSDIGRVILMTSDHGFAAACQRIIKAGKELLLFVKQGLKLIRTIAANFKEHFSVLKINDSFTTDEPTVFLKLRNGTLREVPFENGMPLEKFCKRVKAMGIHRKHMVRWLNECMLTVKDNHVFVNESCFWATDPIELLFQGVSETPEFI